MQFIVSAQDLQRELEWLTEAVEQSGKSRHYPVYSLTLNSLERLHGKHAKKEEKEGHTEEPEETMDEGTESRVDEEEVMLCVGGGGRGRKDKQSQRRR